MVTVTAPSITTSQPPRAAQSTPCEAFFAAGHQHAELLDPPGTAYRTLWEAMRDAAGGGKGARPQLVTRTYAALGGTDLEVAAHVGDAVELLHGAFVMHDDVIDCLAIGVCWSMGVMIEDWIEGEYKEVSDDDEDGPRHRRLSNFRSAP